MDQTNQKDRLAKLKIARSLMESLDTQENKLQKDIETAREDFTGLVASSNISSYSLLIGALSTKVHTAGPHCQAYQDLVDCISREEFLAQHK